MNCLEYISVCPGYGRESPDRFHRAGREQRDGGGPATRSQRTAGQPGQHGHQPGHAAAGRQHAQQPVQAPGQQDAVPQTRAAAAESSDVADTGPGRRGDSQPGHLPDQSGGGVGGQLVLHTL